MKGLELCKNEKTGNIEVNDFNKTGFPLISIFGVIIKELTCDNEAFDYIVCDDLQCEIADFIAINSKSLKICFIHCKHSDYQLSASAFQDVCGQAIKNLNYVISSDISQTDFIKNHFEKWQQTWKLNGYETSRAIKGDVSKAIEAYKTVISNSNVKKKFGLSLVVFQRRVFLKNSSKKSIKNNIFR